MGGLFFYIFVGSILILFIPLSMNFDYYYDVIKAKIVVRLTIIKIIKIFGGYVTFYDKGFALHKNEKTAVLLPFNEMDNERKRFSFIKTFKFKKIQTNIQCGVDYFFTFDFIRKVIEILKNFNQELVESNVSLEIIENHSLKIAGRCVFCFNLYILLTDFIVYIVGEMKKRWGLRTKKSMI